MRLWGKELKVQQSIFIIGGNGICVNRFWECSNYIESSGMLGKSPAAVRAIAPKDHRL